MKDVPLIEVETLSHLYYNLYVMGNKFAGSFHELVWLVMPGFSRFFEFNPVYVYSVGNAQLAWMVVVLMLYGLLRDLVRTSNEPKTDKYPNN